MGAVYSVTMEIKYTDESEVVNSINQYIDAQDPEVLCFDLKGIDRTLLTDLMKVFFTKDAAIKSEPVGIFNYPAFNGKITVNADFDASYGWLPVMTDMFTCIADVVHYGYLIIYPDNDRVALKIQDGELIIDDDLEEAV